MYTQRIRVFIAMIVMVLSSVAYCCNIRPVADPVVVASATECLRIDFDRGSSNDPDGTIVEYRWNFGDGSDYSYEESGTHVYDSAGYYEVTLRVVDNYGASDTETCVVVVGPGLFSLSAPQNGSFCHSDSGVFLDWDDSPYADYYKVYMNGSYKKTVYTSSWTTGTLKKSMEYNWYVVAGRYDQGCKKTSSTWSFITELSKIACPSPANGANDVKVDDVLDWDSYWRRCNLYPYSPYIVWPTRTHAYLGTSYSAVSNATENSAEYIGGGRPISLMGRNKETTYFWRVDADYRGCVTEGDVWEFTTINSAPVALNSSVFVESSKSVGITLSAYDVDGDELTYHAGTPSHGSLAGTAPKLTYTHDGSLHGDSFTFYANDGTENSNTATVNINLHSVYIPPLPQNKVYGETFGDHFGISVAVDKEMAIIGAYKNDSKNTNAGAAYIYTPGDSEWIEAQELTASDGAAEDYFGYAVAIDGNKAVVGAYQSDPCGSNSGAVYVFAWDGNSWGEETKLSPADGSADDHFGYSVAIDDNMILVGAPQADPCGADSGSAYTFAWNGSSWNEDQKLYPGDGTASDFFGYSVAIDGNTVVVGAYKDDLSQSNAGSAYVYTYDGSDWNYQAKLIADDNDRDDYFGCAVAVEENTAAIGALGDSDFAGSVYVFTRSGLSWNQQQKLTDSYPINFRYFGNAVSIDNDRIMVGCVRDVENGDNVGSFSVFKYALLESTWIRDTRVIASDGEQDDHFGCSVSLSGDCAFVGAYGDDDKGVDAGAAYFYNLAIYRDIDVQNQTFAVSKGVAETVELNANDPDGDLLNYVITSDPCHGTATNNSNLSLTYEMDTDCDGTDSLKYRAYDNEGHYSAEATVTFVAPENERPIVDAGSDQLVTEPVEGSTTVNLDGTVYDDGLPYWFTEITWSQIDGPNTAVFDDANSEDTTVTLSKTGNYIFQLDANDGMFSTSDIVYITVLPNEVLGLPSPNSVNGDQFGMTVAIDGNTAVVYGIEPNSNGHLYVYAVDGFDWV